jgi:hypothetical protein
MRNGRELVRNLKTCERCGDALCTWVESKGGKWMLVDAHVDTYGRFTVRTTAPYDFHKCTTQKTPKAIDAKLGELHEARMYVQTKLDRDRDALALIEKGGRPQFGLDADHYRQQIRDGEALRETLYKMTEHFNHEFERRGGWLRYFLVTSSVGHVHRGMDCSTCHDTTTYAWLVDLADCDEDAMIREYGTKACTTCFPKAPAHPAWIEAQRRDEAEAARVCPGSGTHVGYGDGRRYAECERCGAMVAKTKNLNLRKHKAETVVSMGVE